MSEAVPSKQTFRSEWHTSSKTAFY